jgi:hypothetical protein
MANNNSGKGTEVALGKNNVFNTALGKVTELLSGAKQFTETQSNFGKRVGDKVVKLQELVAKLQRCKEQIRGIRVALRQCEEQSASSLAAAQSAGQQAETAAREAGRKSGRESAAAALEAAAANFQALSADLTSLTTSMNSIDDVDLQALETEVNEICAAASGEGGGGKSGGDGGGTAALRRAVTGTGAFKSARNNVSRERGAEGRKSASRTSPGSAWGSGPPRGFGSSTKRFGGGYRYGKSKSRRSTRKRSPSKSRRSAGKAGKAGKKTRRRKRRR